MKANKPLALDSILIPETFLVKMQGLLGPEYQAFHKCLSEPSVAGLRVNPHKISPPDLLARLPYQLSPVRWCPNGFSITPEGIVGIDSSPGKHPYHAAGLYYLQEPTAMAPVEILNPQPGERVLDLAAAPGGKTTQIISRMGNTGLVVANEVHPGRVWDLAENLERWGARNTIVLNETPARLAEKFDSYFDRVLLDAPCSGEGMFRKSAAARKDWSPELVDRCAARQTIVLNQAARMLSPGGTIVYSTCTFSPQENEAVIARFLESHLDFELVEIRPHPAFLPGRPDWAAEASPATASQLIKAIRLWPHHLDGDGHFIARLKRRGKSSDKRPPSMVGTKIPSDFLSVFQDFCKTTLQQDLNFDRLLLQGTYLYQAIPGSPDLTQLHAIHSGWWLGAYKRSQRGGTLRFEPAHALALGLQSNQVQRTISLDLTAAVHYLQGETISDPGPDGWMLVCVDSHPLGWGKRSAGIIKNYYPKGLRWK